MAPLLLCFWGIVLAAAWTWRFGTNAARKDSGITALTLLWAFGLVVIMIAAIQAESQWLLRFCLLSLCLAFGGLLGEVAIAATTRNQAGVVLATLGKSRNPDQILLSVITVLLIAGTLAANKRGYDTATTLVPLVQTFLVTAFCVRGWVMASLPWLLTERGIVGPNLFVPWDGVTGFYWKDADTIAVTIQARRVIVRRLMMPVQPDHRQKAEAIIASKTKGTSIDAGVTPQVS